jgi:hypothetical protein
MLSVLFETAETFATVTDEFSRQQLDALESILIIFTSESPSPEQLEVPKIKVDIPELVILTKLS